MLQTIALLLFEPERGEPYYDTIELNNCDYMQHTSLIPMPLDQPLIDNSLRNYNNEFVKKLGRKWNCNHLKCYSFKCEGSLFAPEFYVNIWYPFFRRDLIPNPTAKLLKALALPSWDLGYYANLREENLCGPFALTWNHPQVIWPDAVRVIDFINSRKPSSGFITTELQYPFVLWYCV